MLDAARSLSLSIDSAPPLPRVAGLDALYRHNVEPRRGEFIMIAGRSGQQKSGFALWWVSQMNLPTLYFSADMTSRQASVRLASSLMDMTTEQVERLWHEEGGAEEIVEALRDLNITFSYGPISWSGVDEEIEAWVELHDSYPEVIVFDNLMDIEGAESDYTEQMMTMQLLWELSRSTKATVVVLHHASDASYEAASDPYKPPSRKDIKNKLGEKPEMVLTVALNPNRGVFAVAPVKNRMGFCDMSGGTFVELDIEPEKTRFGPLTRHRVVEGTMFGRQEGWPG